MVERLHGDVKSAASGAEQSVRAEPAVAQLDAAWSAARWPSGRPGMGSAVKPGVSVGTRNAEICRCGRSASRVGSRAKTSATSAIPPLVIQIFSPSKT
jgi:hypothetical protein